MVCEGEGPQSGPPKGCVNPPFGSLYGDGDSLGSAEFRQAHADAQGRPSAADFTSTGHIDEHYSIGPANGRIVRGMLDAGQVTASQ